MRVCLEPGCPELGEARRCAAHTRQRDRERGSKLERGYDAAYYRRRKRDVAAMRSGAVLACWRCARAILPHDYSLGHCDDDRSVIHGPEHLTCNVGSNRGGCPHASHAGS